jgi:uncharacterized membrane protein YdjX (TVP38/TMEM64 family)
MNSVFRSFFEEQRRFSIIRRLLASPGMWCIVLVIIAAWLAQHYVGVVGGAEVLRQRFGLSAMLPLIVVHALVSVSPLPGEVVAFTNSMVFGFQLGVVCSWSGWMLGAVIEYRLVRKATNDLGLSQSSLWTTRAPKWLQSFPVDHPCFLICARWLPFGCHIVNTAAGAAAVPLWRHIWCSAIGIVPLAVIVAALGSGVANALMAG